MRGRGVSISVWAAPLYRSRDMPGKALDPLCTGDTFKSLIRSHPVENQTWALGKTGGQDPFA